MTKFKVGDVVERTGKLSFTWESFAAADAGPYVVTSVSGGWIQINGYMGCDGYNIHPFQASNFNRVEQDDPLPPAPESGVYFNHDNSRKATLTAEEAVVALGVDGTARKVRLTAETALVLAHDLTRMAMEIKRKEKQNA